LFSSQLACQPDWPTVQLQGSRFATRTPEFLGEGMMQRRQHNIDG
jgi:hypothetical protein